MNMIANNKSHNRLITIIHEEIIEGVADVYAQKAFGIPDAEKGTVSGVEKNAVQQQGTVIHRDGDWMLLKNPGTLNDLGKEVRGIITPDGDYYTENYSKKIHYDLLAILAQKNILPQNPKKDWSKKTPQQSGFLTVQRYKDTDVIAIGESNRLLYDMNFYRENIAQYNQLLAKAKIKNPHIRFENKLVGTKFFTGGGRIGRTSGGRTNRFSVTDESILMKNNI
jgi:hypothetical protein